MTGATLTRFFGFHVAVLPALTTILLLFHLGMVQKHGMSAPPHLQSVRLKTLPFFPNVFLRDVLAWYILLGVLVWLCAFYPWELGAKADPFASAPVGIQPEWYFLFMFESLKHIPSHILGLEGEMLGVLAFSAGALLWLLVPLWDNILEQKDFQRVMNLAGAFVVLFILGMTLVAVT